MDYGKLPNLSLIDRVDFRLPPTVPLAFKQPPSTVRRRRRLTIGCPIWGVKPWVGTVYPPGAKAGDFLKHYARQFNGIELNTSFYRIPDAATIGQWLEVTPTDFRFCPKVHQDLSRDPQLALGTPLIGALAEMAMRLQDRLGPCFLQLPPSFTPIDLPILKAWLRAIAPAPLTFPMTVEFRNPMWFKKHALIPAAVDALAEAGAGAVITDVAGLRNAVHLSVPSPTTLVRFVGNQLHASDYARVDEWADRLGAWFSTGLQEAHFFIHQPENIESPELVNRMIARISATWDPSLVAELALRPWKSHETTLKTDSGREAQLGLFG